MAPSDHHAMVVFEASIPISTLVSVVTLYVFSPVSPLVEEIITYKGLWPYTMSVPLLFPIVLLSFLYLTRAGLAVIPLGIGVFWLLIALLLSRPNNSSQNWYSAIAVLVSFTLAVLGFWIDYRRQHVLTHQSHSKVNENLTQSTDASSTFADLDEYENEIGDTKAKE
eukprot:3937617-Rhodomonas_salina.1